MKIKLKLRLKLKRKPKFPPVKSILTFVYFLSLFLTSGYFSVLQFSDVSLHLHHLVFVLLLLDSIRERSLNLRKTIVPIWISLFFYYIVLCSIWNFGTYGFSGPFVNFVYSYLLIVVFVNYYKETDLNTIKGIIEKVIALSFFLVTANMLIQYDAILRFVKNPFTNHPVVKTLVGGGVNLEASLLAIYSLFLLNKKNAYVYLIWGLVISLLYGSRAGMVINLLVILYYFLVVKGVKSVTVILISGTGLLILIGIIFFTSIGKYVIQRFMDTGNESGSIGRINMWMHCLSVFYMHPLGVGAGNAMKAISQAAGRSFSESNVHNIYLQYLLDEGIVGFLFIVGSLLNILYSAMKDKRNVWCIFLLIYLIQGLVQTRGFEPWAVCIVPLYFISKADVHSSGA